MIWFTSDLHLGHDKNFVWGRRGYSSVSEMNKALIEKWNSLISEEDDVYILGDLVLGPIENVNLLKELKGKIHIVLGNHDTPTREEAYKKLNNVVEVCFATKIKYKKLNFFLTHYPCLTGNIDKESIKEMVFNLYGHTHQTDSSFYKDMFYMYHVGVESHNGYPISIEDIIKEIKEKKNND